MAKNMILPPADVSIDQLVPKLYAECEKEIKNEGYLTMARIMNMVQNHGYNPIGDITINTTNTKLFLWGKVSPEVAKIYELLFKKYKIAHVRLYQYLLDGYIMFQSLCNQPHDCDTDTWLPVAFVKGEPNCAYAGDNTYKIIGTLEHTDGYYDWWDSVVEHGILREKQ